MADIFEEAGGDGEEDLQEEDIQIMDVTNGSNKENRAQKVKVKQLTESLKLEIKPKDRKNQTAHP